LEFPISVSSTAFSDFGNVNSLKIIIKNIILLNGPNNHEVIGSIVNFSAELLAQKVIFSSRNNLKAFRTKTV